MTHKKANLIILATLFCFASFAQKYNAEVLEYQSDYSVKGDEVTEHILIKTRINKQEGDEYSICSIPYSKNRKIERFDAWIEYEKGLPLYKLKKNEAYDKNAYSDGLYTDHFIKIFKLTVNEYPHIIVTEYNRTLRNIMLICDWSPKMYEEIPVLKASLSVTIPKGYAYKKYLKGSVNETIEELPDGSTKLRYTSAIATPFKDEIFPLPDCNLPTVTVLPVSFVNEREGSWDSWQSYGYWISELNAGMDVLPDTEKAIVDKIINGVSDKREITRKLYHYLQDNTRYINVSIGIGNLMPYPAEYVCKNRYGDCKALTNYMKALLDYAGIDSYYCVVNAGNSVKKFETENVSHQFNHAILAVPIENDTIWLENTSNIDPFAHMGPFTQNRPALLINGNESKLVNVPSLNKWQVLDTKKMEFEIDNDGNATVKQYCSFRGASFDYYNGLSNILDKNDQDRRIRNTIDLENAEVTDWEIIKKNRDSASIDFNANLKLRKVLNTLGTEYFISVASSDIPTFTNTANRTQDVMLPYPVFIRDTLKYNLPEGLVMKDIPQPLHIESQFGNYNLNIILNDNSIVYLKEFELYPAYYPLSSYPEFYKFLQSVYKAEKSKLIIKHL